jgi:putative flippase GtrA
MTTAMPLSIGQLARFVLVGASNTAISFAAYALLVSVSTPYVLAAAVAFALGAVNGYALNRRWTFSARDSRRSRLVYVCVQTAGALATSLLVWLLVHEAATGRIGAYAGAIPPVALSMFLANRLWTFAERN